MSILPMRKVEIVALRRDIDAILERLGEAGCFQLASREAGPAEEEASSAQRKLEAARGGPNSAALGRVQTIRKSLGLDFPEEVPAGTRMPTPREEAALEALWQKVAGFDADWNANQERIAKTRETLDEARAFAGLNLPWRELDHLSFLAIRIGYLNTGEVDDLVARVGERGMVFPVDGKNLIVAATTKTGRFALDTELGKSGFAPKIFGADFAGIPLEVPAALEKELEQLEKRTMELERRRVELKAELSGEWSVLAASYAVADAIEGLKTGLEGSEQSIRLVGWMPRNTIKPLAAELAAASGGRVALRTFAPREVESVRKGEEEVPVLLKRRPFFSSFERMVTSFGVPMYGGIDPTPFVGTFFVFLFSIMFGDVGQGGIILLAGIALQFEWIKGLKKWKIFAPIVMAAGAGSMIMGLLVGSVFSNEEWLAPFERILTRLILGEEKDRFLPLLDFLLKGEKEKIIAFFGFTIAIGVVVNSLGLVFNIIDRIKTGKYGEALFSKTGLCGAIFLWWAIGMGVRVLLGGPLGWWDGIGLGLPVLLLIFEEGLQGLVDGHKHHNDDGAFANVIKGFVMVIEVFSYYLSNSLSFLRVGAFAISHIVLSFVTFKMIEMVGSSALGTVSGVLIFILFNAIILVLEGMVVAIQVVRLQYYEFLSKFLTETGTLFAPFRFRFSKE
jgi:V/A-type H+-transporting ATPase subunit I